MVQASFLYDGRSIDHTPGSAITAGDVVVIGTRLVAIAKRDIAASALGALAVEGIFTAVKDSSTLTDGDPVYWDADGNPVDGDAGTGAFSGDSSLGPFAGWVLADAATGAETCIVFLRSIAANPFEGAVDGNLTVAGTATVTSASASALAVGRQGATQPGLKVDASVSSCITGLEIIPRATGAGVTLATLGGTNEDLLIAPKGSGGVKVTSTNASALAVGRQGATDPGLKVDASTGSCVTGLEVKSLAAASGVQVTAISSGTNEGLLIDAKGTGDITLQGTATGAVVIPRLKLTAQTVTADDAEGAGNTILPGVTSVVMDAVTNDADDFIVLPALADVPDGHVIRIYGEANSNFEVRTPAASTELINAEDCDGTKEYLFTKLEIHTFIKANSTIGWIAHGVTALGAAVTPVVPDA